MLKSKQNSILNELYAGKNKAYGSYYLRKNANLIVLVSFVVVVVIIAGILTIAGFLDSDDSGVKLIKDDNKPKRVVEYASLAAPPPIEAIQKPKPKGYSRRKVRSTIKFIAPTVKKDEEVTQEELIPTQEEIQKVAISTKTIEGDDDYSEGNWDNVDVVIPKPEKEQEEKKEGIRKEIKSDPFDIVEKMPGFVGGEDALYGFINENINYPQDARDYGIEGTVYVQFVVTAAGEIENVMIIESLFDSCDEEVLRVIGQMPNWEPGVHNDKKVPVYVRLPVRFKLRKK